MIFTQNQIQEILSILQRYELVFIAGQVGYNYLTPLEILTLKKAGIDVNQFKNSKGIIEHAFLFGILSEAIGDSRAKKMSYEQFQKFLASGNFIPLNETQQFSLDYIKQRSYNDIKGLGNRIRQGTANVILKSNSRQQLIIRDQIKKVSIKATELRYGPTTMAQELGELTGDWERDWLRISYYILHESYNHGRSQNILSKYGDDAEVYFDVFPGACKHCKELFLEDPEDPDSKPKIFKLKDIIANGNNIGRKVAEYLPTISPIHPYCRCIINLVPKDMDWDYNLRAFVIPKKYVSNNPKLNNVKLDINVSKGEISEEINGMNLNPSEAQKKYGNYKKAHVSINGFDITIENPKGSYRSGVDEKGKSWKVKMNNHYGYFKNTEGKDGDHIDVFIGENLKSDEIFVVDQINTQTKEFDESKVMLGFDTIEEAKTAYLSNYEKGWGGMKKISKTNIDDFKKWLYDGQKQRKPFSEYSDNKN